MAMPVGAGYGSPEVPLAGPVSPPSYAANAPHGQFSNHAAVDDSAAPYAEDAAPIVRRSGRFRALIVLLLLFAAGALLLGAAAVTVAIIARARGQAIPNPLGGKTSYWPAGEAAPAVPRFTPAKGHSVRLGPARVEIVRVEIGEARGKDSDGNVIISDGDFLQILVRVENNTPLPLDYRSWYGNDFTESSGVKHAAQRVVLHDDAQRAYRWVLFDDVERVRWHTPKASIPPRKTVEDVIIFELPAGATKDNIKFLRLELPAAAVGFRDEYYRFEIPREMIEGLDS